MKQVILASSSPRRKQLLEKIGVTIKVVPSSIEEKLNPRLKPKRQAEVLSMQKAETVAKQYKDAIILAADTIVYIDNEIIGKPHSLEDAKRILKKLSGKTHTVITGYTIIYTAEKKYITDSVETAVTFRKLTDQEISKYIKKENPLDKAGAYGVQGYGSLLIENINGDFFNVVGLPIAPIAIHLKKLGLDIL